MLKTNDAQAHPIEITSVDQIYPSTDQLPLSLERRITLVEPGQFKRGYCLIKAALTNPTMARILKDFPCSIGGQHFTIDELTQIDENGITISYPSTDFVIGISERLEILKYGGKI